ncbi:MAG: dihydrofolate synthase / folylpolyglutamate synthase [Acidimicrobiaceae bacterium]|nr:dihydrofolate synthase / folylpolyglutamate synthase [Acidimicrobiaceae bacterium]
MNYREALAYLDEHAGYETTGRVTSPSLDRIERLVGAMGDPQHACPVIHITGTNGKGSTAQIITRLLVAQGLTVGTYTSPHLETVNERLARDGEAISDDDLAEQIAAIADLEGVVGVRPSYFEILTAAAYRWFADIAVDVAVVEVGLLGRWDATNVADARIAVVTNVGYDHTEFAGPRLSDVAAEKAGIIKPGSFLVLGETDPDLAGIFRAKPSTGVIERDIDFAVDESTLALGGRLLAIQTPLASYTELFLPLHGHHQGDNAALALAAVESFFGAPISVDIVTEGFAAVTMPGRFEVLGHQPLVIIDGAHNPPGADVCASVMADDFDPAGQRILVVGLLKGRDPQMMLEALRAEEAGRLICCTPPSARSIPAEEVAAVARRIGIADVIAIDDVAKACDVAIAGAESDDAILVTGSLYTVGAARAHLRHLLR